MEAEESHAAGVNRAAVHGDVKSRKRRSLLCLSSPWSDHGTHRVRYLSSPKVSRNLRQRSYQRESVDHNDDDGAYKNSYRYREVFPIHLSQRNLAGFIEAFSFTDKRSENNFIYYTKKYLELFSLFSLLLKKGMP